MIYSVALNFTFEKWGLYSWSRNVEATSVDEARRKAVLNHPERCIDPTMPVRRDKLKMTDVEVASVWLGRERVWKKPK